MFQEGEDDMCASILVNSLLRMLIGDEKLFKFKNEDRWNNIDLDVIIHEDTTLNVII